MSFVTGQVDNGILFVTFEDPGSRNSWSLKASRELRAILGSSATIKALVFTSRGRVFCSGGNLSDYAALSALEEGHKINDEIASDLAFVSSLPFPTVCAVQGDCFGGGVELVSAFDVVLAAPHVYFGLWQKRIALSYGWGGGARLASRIGETRLREWSLSSRSVLAIEAREAGLVQEMVLAENLAFRARETAMQLSRGSSAAGAALKTFDSASERDIFHSLWWSDEHRAALKSRKR